jgi:antitoxin component YwqK of YwqJK toxin-antitoxin module
MVKKWNGKIIEYRKDGSKMREIDYNYGGVTLRMEWDEAGNLTKEETYPIHKPRGVNEQSFETNEVTDLDTENPDVDLSFDNEGFAPERKYPYKDLTFREGANKERIAYAKGEEEPFTGSSKTYYLSGSKRTETTFKDGKPVLKSTWDEDGNLIEKETF